MIAGRHFTVLRKASVQWKMETHAQSQSKERTMRMVTTYAGTTLSCPCSLRRKSFVHIKNPYLDSMDEDVLYHLDLGTKTHNLPEMFGDVK
ncbi:hypothetical protein MJT46_004281, partial [Ovis ammon polii x Ovis aries]